MTDSPFQPLPSLGELFVDEPLWTYPIPNGLAGGTGATHLRMWWPADQNEPVVAVVTELDVDASVTDTVVDIHRHIGVYLDRHGSPGRRFLLLEHWPTGIGSDPVEHLDQARMDPTKPAWRRVWPTPATNPHHTVFEDWMRQHGHRIVSVPADSRR